MGAPAPPCAHMGVRKLPEPLSSFQTRKGKTKHKWQRRRLLIRHHVLGLHFWLNKKPSVSRLQANLTLIQADD